MDISTSWNGPSRVRSRTGTSKLNMWTTAIWVTAKSLRHLVGLGRGTFGSMWPNPSAISQSEMVGLSGNSMFHCIIVGAHTARMPATDVQPFEGCTGVCCEFGIQNKTGGSGVGELLGNFNFLKSIDNCFSWCWVVKKQVLKKMCSYWFWIHTC